MTVQDEIKKIMNDRKVKQAWLASELGISEQRLSYQLNGANSFDYELYQKIKKIFKSAGILTNTPDECIELSSQTLELSQLTTLHLSIITKEVRKGIADNKLDENERMRLKFNIQEAREIVLSKLDELEKLIS